MLVRGGGSAAAAMREVARELGARKVVQMIEDNMFVTNSSDWFARVCNATPRRWQRRVLRAQVVYDRPVHHIVRYTYTQYQNMSCAIVHTRERKLYRGEVLHASATTYLASIAAVAGMPYIRTVSTSWSILEEMYVASDASHYPGF